MKKKIFSIFLLVGLAGCQTIGGPTIGFGNEKFDPTYISKHAFIGKSTEQDILNSFGEPAGKQTVSNITDTWHYEKNAAGSNILSAVAGFVPGSGMAGGAVGMADVHPQGSSNHLEFVFRHGILRSWSN